MKNLLTITISLLAFTLAGCNFYTDIDADWNGDENDGDSCDGILLLLEAEDDRASKADLAAEYARCAGQSPDVDPGDAPGNDCDYEDGCDSGDPLPEGIDCQVVQSYVSNGTDEEALQLCRDFQIADDTCLNIIDRCLGQDSGADDPSHADICVRGFDILADNGIDPDMLTADEALRLCETYGAQSADGMVDEQLCYEFATTCFEGDAGNTGPGADDSMCQLAYDQLEAEGIDPQTVSPDEAFDLCVQNTDVQTTEEMCRDIADRCFTSSGGGANTTPTPGSQECVQIIDQASAYGVAEPDDQTEADTLYSNCLMVADESLCRDLLACYGF